MENALDFVDRFVTCLQQAGGGYVKVFVQGIECDDNSYCVPEVSSRSHRSSETLAKVFHLRKHLHYWLFVPFWFNNLWVVKQFLEDGVYSSLANFGEDAFEFVLHLLGVVQVHDIESDLIVHTFSDDSLGCSYCHAVLLDFLQLKTRVFAHWSRPCGYEVPHVFLK